MYIQSAHMSRTAKCPTEEWNDWSYVCMYSMLRFVLWCAYLVVCLFACVYYVHHKTTLLSYARIYLVRPKGLYSDTPKPLPHPNPKHTGDRVIIFKLVPKPSQCPAVLLPRGQYAHRDIARMGPEPGPVQSCKQTVPFAHPCRSVRNVFLYLSLCVCVCLSRLIWCLFVCVL